MSPRRLAKLLKLGQLHSGVWTSWSGKKKDNDSHDEFVARNPQLYNKRRGEFETGRIESL